MSTGVLQCPICFQGDERVRTALFKLRQTWKAIFPERKLYALDLNTQTVDPNWPVCAAAPIHLNPKFFKKPPAEVRRPEFQAGFLIS